MLKNKQAFDMDKFFGN